MESPPVQRISPPHKTKRRNGGEIGAIKFTYQELQTFESLRNKTNDRNQVERISARLQMEDFVAKHGHEKCLAIVARLKQLGRFLP